MARPATRAEPAPKCPHCKGWACEPDVYPMQICMVCNGTGRPPSAAAQQPELTNG